MDDFNDKFQELFGSQYGALTRELGSGTYGKVYLSKSPLGRRRYAVKLEEKVELLSATDPTTREIEAMKTLRGVPNVIQLLDYRVVTEPRELEQQTLRIKRYHLRYPYSIIVMPEYDMTLYKYMLEYGKRGFPAGKLISMLLNGLVGMTDRRVVNCDVKQLNVLVKLNGDGVLVDLVYADFGMAKYIPPGTQTAVSIFSPPYCTFTSRPVELYGHAGTATLTTDAFSVACVLYECLIGFYLFPNGVSDIAKFHTGRDVRMESKKALFKKQLREVMLNEDEFYDIWLRMLAIRPNERPGAGEILQVFENCPLFAGSMETYVRPDTSDPNVNEDLESDQVGFWNNNPFSDTLLRFVLSEHRRPDAILDVLSGMELRVSFLHTKVYVMSRRHLEKYYGVQDLTYDSD